MQTIKETAIKEFIINKSKFITKLYPVFSKEEIDIILEQLKADYKDATHICYAYILEDNIKRANDDGEPSGTAGMPILNVLEQKKLNYVLAVVIRYFGGIKLGAGGLVRAYSNCVAQTLEENMFTDLVPGIILELTYEYENAKTIDNILENYIVLDKTFKENIHAKVKIKAEDYLQNKNYLDKICIIKEKEHSWFS